MPENMVETPICNSKKAKIFLAHFFILNFHEDRPCFPFKVEMFPILDELKNPGQRSTARPWDLCWGNGTW